MDQGQTDVALRATEVPMLEPEIVRQIRGLAAMSWGSKRIAATLGISRGAARRYLRGAMPGAQERPRARRLGVEQLGRDLDALGVGFGRFVRYSLWTLPEQIGDKAIQRGEGLYRTFLSKVADQFRAGGTFTAQVFPTRRPPAVPPTATSGGRDEGGRS